MRNLRWRIFALSLVLAIVLIMPAVASASNYQVTGIALNSNGSLTLGYGTFSFIYRYNPTVVSPDGKHVSSIYVDQNSQNGVEIGWYRRYGNANPQGFMVKQVAGRFTEQALGAMGSDQYPTFEISRAPGTTNWKGYINGTYMYQWSNMGWSYGWSRLGSERNIKPGDDMYSHFQYLRYRDGDVTWKYWPIIRADTNNDNEYFLFVDTPNHQAWVRLP